MAINEKMGIIMASIGHIAKDKTNTHQGFKFRGIDQFMIKLNPILVENKVVIQVKCLESNIKMENNSKGRLQAHCTVLMEYSFFCCEDGDKFTCIFPGEAIDYGDKGINQAMSVALKYCIAQTFCVPTEDTSLDPDEKSPQHGNPANPQQNAPVNRNEEDQVRKKKGIQYIGDIFHKLQAKNIMTTFTIPQWSDSLVIIEGVARTAQQAEKEFLNV